MGLAQCIRIALRALRANKLRAALTMLGMVIGVGAVIALMSIGQGAQAMITSQIRGMGTNLLFISPGSTQNQGVRTAQGSAATLTYDDALAIADPANAPSVALVAPVWNTFMQVIANGQNASTRITGVTAEYQDVRNSYPAVGEFISKANVDSASSVAVLGSKVADSLFGEQDPLGQQISVGMGNRRVTLRVIGLMESKGATAMGDQDDMIFVPITTMFKKITVQRTVRGTNNVSTINVQVSDEKLLDQAIQEIGELLRQRHRAAQDDFTIRSQDDMLSTANQITGIMTILLGSIAGISLLVGGIGIMNIMLVSVTERTREIGIRKAVGAKWRDVLTQFLVEAIVVSVIGGAIGILLGWGSSRAISAIDLGGQSLQTEITLSAIALACGVSAGVGLFFGIYPATRAARLNPIDALRYE
ncbi:MAG: ABC transporter permease [Chloroflexi bacterium]|nr:ABC transporter permease [Chloroflexota bacterium]